MRMGKKYAEKLGLVNNEITYSGKPKEYVDLRYVGMFMFMVAALVGLVFLIRWPIVGLSAKNQFHVRQCNSLAGGKPHYLHSVDSAGGNYNTTCTVILNQQTFQTKDWQL